MAIFQTANQLIKGTNQPLRFHKIRQNSQRESVLHDPNASAPADTRTGFGECGESHRCESNQSRVQNCTCLFLPLQVGHILNVVRVKIIWMISFGEFRRACASAIVCASAISCAYVLELKQSQSVQSLRKSIC